ncbi:TRM11 family SAM-dependent methyltransferase [Paenibacillus harenae]|uniref:tRNA G10 N-methylase Trm11 n=1 Tax=Paenibacillus harenae TaxID=306543 RepID=A0ABT9UC03_PAEHA|nr:RNA methyltransferase [Paenibacillus harenae]MDQ0115749.1 tRNA G10 N-methylase Trm11 [Paenibacillus harenae]
MFIYTYACHEDETELCELELSLLLRKPCTGGAIESDVEITADRSPFIRRKIHARLCADSMEELVAQLPGVELEQGQTFKVLFTSATGEPPIAFEERRQHERTAGAAIRGKADMRKPDRLFGLIRWNGRWLFGPCEENSAAWLEHQKKPQNYSTALPVRAARAIVNIAAPGRAEAVKLIDPCCGIGTVLIEAMSMGIDIEGVDLNPLAVRGARLNLAHFGYADKVKLGDMRELTGHYDAAIIDMPYNLCSVLPEEEQLDMLRNLRRFAARAVIVTTEPAERQAKMANWRIQAVARLRKGSFTRYITVVE